MHCVELVRKQGKINWAYILQLSTVSFNFLTFDLSSLRRKATKSIPTTNREFKAMNFDVNTLHIDFLGTLGFIL